MPYGSRLVFEESVSAVTATPSVALGTRRIEGGKEFVYAYNAGTTAAVGYGMIASLNSGYSCVVSSAAGDMLFGVVQNNDLTAAQYGWIQTKGPVHVVSVNAVAAAAPIALGTNGAFEQVLTALAGGTAVACGVSAQQITSAGTGVAFIRGIA